MDRKTLIALSTILVLSGCSRAQVPKEGLAEVVVDSNQHSSSNKLANANAGNAGPGEKFDPVEDELISNETLKAWRHALAHDDDKEKMSEDDWKTTRARDEEEAMVSLKALASGHPNSSYIKTMMGQVKQHFGKREEAAAYYEEALLQNRKDPVLMFKAAEMRRNNGNNKQALVYYNQVVKIQPDFPGAQVGMARCLLADAATADEGRKILKEVLAKNPDDKDAQTALNSADEPADKPAKKPVAKK